MATNVTAQQARLGQPIFAVSDAISDGDTGDTVRCIEIPAGSWVPPYGVSVYIAEVFAGGSPLLDVGDEDDQDGWVDQTENTATTLGAYTGVASDLAIAGKYYPTAQSIEVVVSGSLTGGTAYVFATYYDVSAVSLAAV